MRGRATMPMHAVHPPQPPWPCRHQHQTAPLRLLPQRLRQLAALFLRPAMMAQHDAGPARQPGDCPPQWIVGGKAAQPFVRHQPEAGKHLPGSGHIACL